MSTFLTERTMTSSLRRLIANGGDVRIAVAFWGTGASNHFKGKKPKKFRIICNLRSGACNPDEIAKLRRRFMVRTHDYLHAKVYWTPTAAIVGSSNLSTNGLVPPDSDAHGWREGNVLVGDHITVNRIGEWFDILWRRSRRITKPMLAEAKQAWKRRAQETSRQRVQGKTLLAAALADPASFEDHKIYLAIYRDHSSDAFSRKLKALARRGKTVKFDDGGSASFRDVSGYENFRIPPGAWLVDCSLINPAKPKVWGIQRVPDPLVPIDNGIIAFKQPAIELLGRRLKLPPNERILIERNMVRLGRAADRRHLDLLHLTDAARIINRLR